MTSITARRACGRRPEYPIVCGRRRRNSFRRSFSRPMRPPIFPHRPRRSVSVATAQSRRIATWEEFSGRLEAIERVEVRPASAVPS